MSNQSPPNFLIGKIKVWEKFIIFFHEIFWYILSNYRQNSLIDRNTNIPIFSQEPVISQRKGSGWNLIWGFFSHGSIVLWKGYRWPKCKIKAARVRKILEKPGNFALKSGKFPGLRLNSWNYAETFLACRHAASRRARVSLAKLSVIFSRKARAVRTGPAISALVQLREGFSKC